MRTLTQHIVPGDSANHQLAIAVQDQPGSGGANHLYVISGFDSESNPCDPFLAAHGAPARHSTVLFQNGPIKEVGVNGITHEALLVILIDRMEGFQAGPFASDDSDLALNHLKAALRRLQKRTRDRMARGVEGTHTV